MLIILLGVFYNGIAVILQTTILSQIKMLQGTADLVFLVVLSWAIRPGTKWKWAWAVAGGVLMGVLSEIPMAIYLIGYLIMVVLTNFIQSRLWQARTITLLVMVIIGTLIIQGMSLFYLILMGSPITISNGFYQVILPSILLNFVFLIPAYGIIRETASILYPEKEEIEL